MKLVALLSFVLLACSAAPKGAPYKVYVTDRDSSRVTVILPQAGFPARTIRVGRGPTYVTATHKGDLVLVTNTGDSTVSFVSTARDSVVATIRVGGLLKGIEVDPEDRYALVADEGNASVAVIDLAQRQVVRRIAVNPEPHNFAFDSSSDRAFVTCAGANAVDIVDLARLEKAGSIPAGSQPHNLVFVRGWLAVTSRNLPMVYFCDSTGVFDSVRVSTGHHGIAADPDGRMLYVSGIGSDTVTMIDAAERRVVEAVRVGAGPHGIRVSPHDLLVFVACSGTDEVVVSTVHEMKAATVKAPGFPFWIAVAQQPGATHAPKTRTDYTDVSTDELAGTMKNKDFLLVNVHIPNEGEIPGTDLHVAFNKITENAGSFPEDKSAKIVVYCAGGSMSVIAARKLAELGYTNVYNLKRGFNQWQARGLPFTRAK